jgi:hypothetical protein
VNGEPVAHAPSPARHRWWRSRRGRLARGRPPNTIALIPSASGRVGADPRELGVALLAVELR